MLNQRDSVNQSENTIEYWLTLFKSKFSEEVLYNFYYLMYHLDI